ncbi:efflux RND transporter periplasmic adaptor subunit [Caloramator sp. E03]|uniref:efflux RND transporter periplasmic adaptor subunit n=1 Tax=Caloramator sp. E03 TaxID=2576307 RepID=UPI0011100E1A|nr:efflux RND transporter periplasmic adaptor subunit [Caloramator sp. E03]QCX32957.1 efflux RND transporter periplasmic adaptor subunit [Caloramator sp. E03]
MKNRVGVILIALSLLIFTIGCNTKTSDVSKIIDVQIMSAKKQKIDSSLSISGVLVPVKTVNVFSKLTGQVENIGADVGSNVKAGEIVATLETKTLNTQLQQAQASLNSALVSEQIAKNQAEQSKLNFESVTRAYERTKELYNSGAVSKVEMDDMTTKYEIAKKQYELATGASLNQAKAAISSAQANINNIKVQIENANILSPLNGVVVNRNINVGELASPSNPLFTIADTSTLKLKGTIPQKYIPFVKVGQDIDVQVDIYPNKIYKGKVSNIGPMAINTGMYFPIEISIKNIDNIKPGVSAHAAINISSEEGIVIPSSAIIQNDGESYVYVIENNIAKKRIVEVGVTNDNQCQIISGLNMDEKVAISNVNNLFDNAAVNVK